MSITQNSKILASDVTPKNHADSATTYGTGNKSNYGHVKLSDSISSTSDASSGIAASPKAVKAAYDKAVEVANSGISKSVGDLWIGFDPKSKPANVQLYAGQSLNRSSYAAHWAFVSGENRTVISESEWQAQVTANGFCPYYSSGDGSTTYRMPLMKGVHPQFIHTLAEAGSYKSAGLPNITGYLQPSDGRGGSYGGAFYSTSYSGWKEKGTEGTDYTWNFDASRSNPIYGNSDTVQPPSVTCVLGEYVVGTIATIGEADSVSILASITQLESEINNLQKSSTYITEIGKSGNYWYRKYSDGWIEQGGIATSSTITFLTAFSTTTYIIVANDNADFGSGSATWDYYNVHTKTTTGAKKDSVNNCSWYAAGY